MLVDERVRHVLLQALGRAAVAHLGRLELDLALGVEERLAHGVEEGHLVVAVVARREAQLRVPRVGEVEDEELYGRGVSMGLSFWEGGEGEGEEGEVRQSSTYSGIPPSCI